MNSSLEDNFSIVEVALNKENFKLLFFLIMEGTSCFSFFLIVKFVIYFPLGKR